MCMLQTFCNVARLTNSHLYVLWWKCCFHTIFLCLFVPSCSLCRKKKKIIIWNLSNSFSFCMVAVKPLMPLTLSVCEVSWGCSSVWSVLCWTFMLPCERDTYVAWKSCTVTVKCWRAAKRALQKSGGRIFIWRFVYRMASDSPAPPYSSE